VRNEELRLYRNQYIKDTQFGGEYKGVFEGSSFVRCIRLIHISGVLSKKKKEWCN